MRLASDIIVVRHGNVVLPLRPSLRAALTIHRKYGVGKAVDAISDGNLGIMIEIAVAASDEQPARQIINSKFASEGYDGLRDIGEALAHLLRALYVADFEKNKHPAEVKADTTGKPFDLGSFLEELFEIGTGWLGWSAGDTWEASPREILVAQRGLIAKLKAINGVVDEPSDPEEVTPEQVKAGVAKLRELSGAA
ncbi:MAG: hypothetical protein EOQ39_03615 [Mesorhizobium sp.]|uniref:hypothetical protein n=1 Tax=Mesorhizobium sp. TaxID=1871066 RepID=UPI000FE5EB76|nr:hypothetical protein [Mesorhizobium sp.]RWB08998.1 MAG: hypothetical protein EOQ37_05770 [Mesorhizobium sp.]RWB17419.1 MAG: hypothetical protein EOQ39_03615 [Mesorhizobium sp.]